MAGVATDLIGEFGRSLTLRAKNTSGDAWNPVEGAPTDTSVTGVVVFYGANEIDGTLIQSNDKRCMIDSTVAPTVKMSIIDGGTTYKIIDIEEVKPGDTTILYKLQLRV
jgi:hypothetical protein